MAVEVVGRDEELSALSAVLDRRAAGDGPIAIALEGEAGIGKSTLWRAAVEDARARGLRVLSTRAAESERSLAYTGLGDLLDGVLAEVLPGLTLPRRRALEVALLVEDAAGRRVDQRALGVAVRSALELLAAEPLVIAIDDLQWLDATSASALGFALRRLPEANVLLLWTRRLGEPEQSPAVEDALDGDRVERIRVGPLSVGAIQQILHDRLAHPATRPTLLRLHEVSAGNPFYALELARAHADDGSGHDRLDDGDRGADHDAEGDRPPVGYDHLELGRERYHPDLGLGGARDPRRRGDRARHRAHDATRKRCLADRTPSTARPRGRHLGGAGLGAPESDR